MKKLFLIILLITGFCYSQMIATDVIYLIENYGFNTFDVDALTVETIESFETDTLSTATGVVGTTYSAALNQTTITLTNYSMVTTDAGAAGGHGALKLVDFPEGMIYVLGVVGDMSCSAVSGISATGAVDMALGSATTLTDAETLDNANVDFVAKVDETLTASVGVWDLVTNTPQTEDGHTAATDVWLCVAIENTSITATGTMALSGTIVISWVNTGDY